MHPDLHLHDIVLDLHAFYHAASLVYDTISPLAAILQNDLHRTNKTSKLIHVLDYLEIKQEQSLY